MKIFHGSGKIPGAFQGAVVVLGNFDGVHRGHQIVLHTAKELAISKNTSFGVMSFEPHPRAFFAREKNLFRLSPADVKPLLLEAMGADFLTIYEFDSEFSSLSAREFVERTLVRDLGVNSVVCGHDFHFGKGREGCPTMLKEFGNELGFDVHVVAAQKSDRQDRLYASSAIRADLRGGDVASAAHDLGRWWSLRGKVQKGEGQGRFLGFPTANIPLEKTCETKPGIYAARARFLDDESGQVILGAAYIGSKPTFGTFEPRLEIFLFDFEDDLYGRDMLIEFVAFIRDDHKFETLQELEAQMRDDCERAASILNDVMAEGDPMQAYELGAFFAPKQ